MPDENEKKIADVIVKQKKIARGLQIDLFSSLFTGVASSVLLHPLDRAIYLSIKNKRSFFTKENFKSPCHGLSQTIFQRAFLGSAYYFVQEQMKKYGVPYLKNELQIGETLQHFSIGFAAGSAYAVMTHTACLVKAHAWSNLAHTFQSSAREIYQGAGHRGFVNGLSVAILRDTLFGCSYEIIRFSFRKSFIQFGNNSHLTEKQSLFFCNSTAACLSTILVAPFSYARTIKFSTPPTRKAPTTLTIFKNVWSESEQHKQTPLGRLRFFQDRFRIGIVTLRSALSMALGQHIFDFIVNECNRQLSEEQESLAMKKP